MPTLMVAEIIFDTGVRDWALSNVDGIVRRYLGISKEDAFGYCYTYKSYQLFRYRGRYLKVRMLPLVGL